MKPFLVFVIAALVTVQYCSAAQSTLRLVQANGAVCLDGSPGGYYHRPGTADGAQKWIIHMQGGGYCTSEADCANRATSTLGSSKSWPNVLEGSPLCCYDGGFLSGDPNINPLFYNWNLAFLGYCDGTFFSGNRDQPIDRGNQKLYFSGKKILDAIAMDLLKNAGLANAQEIIVTGCSAGGVATYMHLDQWRAAIPQHIPVHGLADAGFLLEHNTYSGAEGVIADLRNGFTLWNATGGMHQSCVAANSANPWKCLFAVQTYPFINTPLFLVQAKYDSWQIQNILQLQCLQWDDVPKCNPAELKAFMDYGASMLSALTPAINSPKDGVWLNACTQHCQTLNNGGALAWTSLHIDNVLLRDAFANWYYKRSNGKYVDRCDFDVDKCNTCGFK